MLSSLTKTLQAAFILAYADDNVAMCEIASLTREDFRDEVGLRGTTDEFIFVLDQHTALDSTDSELAEVSARVQPFAPSMIIAMHRRLRVAWYCSTISSWV